MKSQLEIKNRIKRIQEKDLFGFESSSLVDFLNYENAKEYLKPECTEDEWNKHYKRATKKNIKLEILDYMPFAWEKANNCRGVSANRSLMHMKAWFWLLDEKLDLKDYKWYGKPQLKKICEKFGWDWKQWHNGLVGNHENDQKENLLLD